jgi:hypothetical protein
MRARRKPAQVRKVEVLRNEEPPLTLNRIPKPAIVNTSQALLHDGLDVMAQSREIPHKMTWEILV